MSDAPAIPIDSAVLTVEEMYEADAAAIKAGTPSLLLMEAAGTHLARALRARWPRCRVLVACGPGNNGGDGFVVARLLWKAGWPVRLALLGSVEALKGDAAVNARKWLAAGGKITPLSTAGLDWPDVVVDALFGAGLSRVMEGDAASFVRALTDQEMPCLAVDMPSGVCGDSGHVLGGADAPAVHADLTVTFFRPKPGHLLFPGRGLCGELEVVDIGIPEAVLAGLGGKTALNGPSLWMWPRPNAEDHKYARGHGVVLGSAKMSGAARLAAAAARRAGAGLITVAAPEKAMPSYMADAPGLLFQSCDNGHDLAHAIEDKRRNGVLAGPGLGVSDATRSYVLAILAAGKSCVLDADALTSFADDPELLFYAIQNAIGEVVLTPHPGEFKSLFKSLDSKLKSSYEASATSGAVVVLKGADTVIAAPDGRVAINSNAPPWLASAGSGDVLAGFVLGLMVQGVPAWEAACAAVWLHGAAAAAVGQGLIAEDLLRAAPDILAALPEGRKPGF